MCPLVFKTSISSSLLGWVRFPPTLAIEQEVCPRMHFLFVFNRARRLKLRRMNTVGSPAEAGADRAGRMSETRTGERGCKACLSKYEWPREKERRLNIPWGWEKENCI